jgi:transcriptional regulator with XRE-family HTH domain
MKDEQKEENLTTKLQATRIKHGFTRNFIADNLGICASYYGKIERGTFTLTLDKIKVLAALYNLPDEVIFQEAMEGVEIRDKRRRGGRK